MQRQESLEGGLAHAGPRGVGLEGVCVQHFDGLGVTHCASADIALVWASLLTLKRPSVVSTRSSITLEPLCPTRVVEERAIRRALPPK